MIKSIKKHLKKIIFGILGIGIASAAMIGLQPVIQPQPLETSSKIQQEEQLFAEIDNNNIVIRVIVADQEFINSGKVGNPKNWIKTSSKGTIRKNYAGRGYIYDKFTDTFLPSIVITNTTTTSWFVPPIR